MPWNRPLWRTPPSFSLQGPPACRVAIHPRRQNGRQDGAEASESSTGIKYRVGAVLVGVEGLGVEFGMDEAVNGRNDMLEKLAELTGGQGLEQGGGESIPLLGM